MAMEIEVPNGPTREEVRVIFEQLKKDPLKVSRSSFQFITHLLIANLMIRLSGLLVKGRYHI